jgi:alkylhydroperoxidase/carboxymuconolactone decarboxylase family protein YurZ
LSAETEKLLAEITAVWGIRYGLLDFFAEVDLDALKVVHGQVMSDTDVTLLDRKTRRFLIISAMIGQQAEANHLQANMRGAIAAGSTKEDLLELINILQPWVGYVSRNKSLEAWRQTFRPDIPTINRVIEAK